MAVSEKLTPRGFAPAESDAEFLQGMLEGIAGVEARAYAQLARMGASPLTEVAVKLEDK